MGPCAHVDPEIVKLLADATAVLYGAIEAARHLPDPKDEAKMKWRKILIADAVKKTDGKRLTYRSLTQKAL
jgi:hypothetical protein